MFGHSPVKERVVALLGGSTRPSTSPIITSGASWRSEGSARVVVRDELLSLVRFLGGNKDALRRNFNPKSAGLKVNDPTEK